VRWRWLLLDYVDPQLELTRAERRRVRRRAWDLGLRSARPAKPGGEQSFWDDLSEGRPWTHVLIGVLQLVLPYAILLGVVVAWIKLIGIRSPWAVLAMYAIFFALSWIMIAVLWRVTWQPRVVRALRDLGYEVCVRCGYCLRGLEETTMECPECGAARERPR
jgi:hypothetical protein